MGIPIALLALLAGGGLGYAMGNNKGGGGGKALPSQKNVKGMGIPGSVTDEYGELTPEMAAYMEENGLSNIPYDQINRIQGDIGNQELAGRKGTGELTPPPGGKVSFRGEEQKPTNEGMGSIVDKIAADNQPTLASILDKGLKLNTSGIQQPQFDFDEAQSTMKIPGNIPPLSQRYAEFMANGGIDPYMKKIPDLLSTLKNKAVSTVSNGFGARMNSR